MSGAEQGGGGVEEGALYGEFGAGGGVGAGGVGEVEEGDVERWAAGSLLEPAGGGGGGGQEEEQGQSGGGGGERVAGDEGADKGPAVGFPQCGPAHAGSIAWKKS